MDAHTGLTLQALAYGLIVATQVWAFVKYVLQGLIAWRNKNKAQVVFIEAMKENHLPHIYETLKAICFYLHIPYEEPKTDGSN